MKDGLSFSNWFSSPGRTDFFNGGNFYIDIVITHGDKDHVNLLPELFPVADPRIQHIYVSKSSTSVNIPAYNQFIDRLYARNQYPIKHGLTLCNI